MELLAGGERLGYPLKSRATHVTEFIDTVERITAGASGVDPSLYRNSSDPADGMIRARSSPGEREVLPLMAEGTSNAGITRRILVTEARSRSTPAAC
jgi:DNA-binding NarL/FixJ family response regulator